MPNEQASCGDVEEFANELQQQVLRLTLELRGVQDEYRELCDEYDALRRINVALEWLNTCQRTALEDLGNPNLYWDAADVRFHPTKDGGGEYPWTFAQRASLLRVTDHAAA